MGENKRKEGVSLISLIITIVVIIILASVIIVNGLNAPEAANKATFINDWSTIQDLALARKLVENAYPTTGLAQISTKSVTFIPVCIKGEPIESKLIDIINPHTGMKYEFFDAEDIKNLEYVGANAYYIDLKELNVSSKYGNGNPVKRGNGVDGTAEIRTIGTAKSDKTKDIFIMSEEGNVYYLQGVKVKEDSGEIRIYYSGNLSSAPEDVGNTPISPEGEDVIIDGWRINAKKGIIYEYVGDSSQTEITIPANIGGINIRGIESKDGKPVIGSNVTSLIISNGIEYIGNGAFKDTNIKSVEIPTSVTIIGDDAFNRTKLLSIVIPDGVTEIGSGAFASCYDMAGNLILPESLTTIGDNAFNIASSMKSVTIPKNVTSIGKNVFTSCARLERIEVDPANNTYSSADGVLFNKNKTTLIRYPQGKKDIYSYTVPTSVKILEENSFSRNSTLMLINLNQGLTTIEKNSFNGCKNLSRMVIPSTVQRIGAFTFSGCTNLTEVKIERLEETIPGAPWGTTIDKIVWDDTGDMGDVSEADWIFDLNTKTITGYQGEAKELVIIPNTIGGVTVERIQNTTANRTAIFSKDLGIKEVIISNGIIEIGDYAFANLALEAIAIPNSVRIIGDNAFRTAAFRDLTLPNQLTTIGTGAFSVCYNLTDVVFPDNLMVIGSSAFETATSLKNVVIPKNVTLIGENAFHNCARLETFTIKKIKNSISGAPWGIDEQKTQIIWEP